MKKLWALVLLLLAALPSTALALEEDALSLDQLDKGPLYAAFAALPEEAREFWGYASIDEMLESFMGDGGAYDSKNALEALMEAIKKGLSGCITIIAPVLALAVLGGICTQLAASYGRGVNEVAQFACYAMAVMAATYALVRTVSQARDAIYACRDLADAAFPILMTLLAATGSTVSAGLFQSATALLTGSVMAVVDVWLLPLVLAQGALAITANIGGGQLAGLQSLVKSIVKWSMGGLGTVYLGVLALKSIAARSVDGVSIRAARFALDKFVPYVGGVLSGSLDSVAGVNLLIKNAFGLCFAVLLAGIMLMPLIRIAMMQLSLRLLSALSGPLGSDRLSKGLSDMADALSSLFAVTVLSLLMLLLTVGMILSCANI